MKKQNRNIWGFKITCRHEWKGVERHVYESESGIYYPMKEIRVHPKWAKNLGFWIHEFSEVAIIEILEEFNYNWNAKFHPKGFNSTFIAHFITPLGENNGCSLDPVTRKNIARW